MKTASPELATDLASALAEDRIARPLPEHDDPVGAFREVPRTGVIYVSNEARLHGFRPTDDTWCNLGQGQPETGPLPGSPDRILQVAIDPADLEYAPIPGIPELREAVAALYNRFFRRGMKSQYSAENVAVSGGGRMSLTRAVAALGQINLGHFLPDYTAYEELLDIFRLVTPIPILLSRERRYEFAAKDFRREVMGRGLGAVLVSNPCNPMGKLISGDELGRWVAVARELECTLLLDEFYSHYVWNVAPEEPGPIVSAARWVEDVERDPVVLFDGLTKNWRYPGWRVTWTLGPKKVIEAIESAGSFLDGGGSRPMQRAALPLLEPDHVLLETRAIQEAFLPKRDFVLRRAREMGMRIDREPDGTFYVFASLRDLPEAIRDGGDFFRAALDCRVVTVPGIFFDVNPGRRRARRLTRFGDFLRLSFGPPMAVLERGMGCLEEMVRERRSAG